MAPTDTDRFLHWLHLPDHACGEHMRTGQWSQLCQSLPSPGNSGLGPTEQLSLWVAEAKGFRIWEQPFHQHMMKAMIHNEKKKKICQRLGTAKSYFQSVLRPYHITVLRVNPSFLVIKSLFLFKLVQVRFLLLITKRADPRMFRCHLENHLCYANIL